MEPFPDLYELISFFEVEPNITDPDIIPWFASTLTFENHFADNKIQVAIEPADECIRFNWSKENVPILLLNLEEVESLVIRNERNRETFIARFREKTGILDFEFMLRPHIQIKWGNKRFYP
ncbi:hypothetical protein [Roseofilum sp. Guam]|uniref:hypothetical protein n=1 Tax=Roseofilum sp. Guam TaxID=2821502 RepID=UPI001B252746|nr:hypothetical protein [Roseofilum sp. Guam]MBP0030795.1 hypothetical protein [Roseofilum sp. Guam]